MSKLVTIIEFNNIHDVKYNLLKAMLKEAGIPYIIINENARSVEPFFICPSNMAIEVKIYEDNLIEANEIIQSIL